MKKILSLALALLMLLSCVSAFADAIPAEGYDGSEVTLKFYHVITKDDQLAIINEAIAEFNKTYPNIHVELENVGGSYNGILNTVKEQLPAGNEPNIAFCYMDHVAAYNDQAGSIQVLDELIDHPVVGLTAEQKADFIPGYYKEGASLGDGKMYALPFYKSTEVLYYNKTFFDENNLTAPVTWDDLEAVCAKIKEINPKYEITCCVHATLNSYYVTELRGYDQWDRVASCPYFDVFSTTIINWSLPQSFFVDITKRTVAMAKKYGKKSERWIMNYNARPADFKQMDDVVDLYESLGVDRLAAWTYRGGYGTVVAAPDALEMWDRLGENYKRVLKIK